MIPAQADGVKAKMNDTNTDNCVKYNDLIFCFVLFVAMWILHTFEMDRLARKNLELETRLTRVEYRQNDSGHPQSN